jgi:ATP-dependent Lhr-like helicase
MLDRYGVLTKGSILTESGTGSFQAAYQVLSAMELNSAVRRGYVIEALGAAQFASPGAVDRLRDHDPDSQDLWLLAACDPANPWGAALTWPDSDGHRPSRAAGALVVLSGGFPILYLERGGHNLLTFGPTSADHLVAGLKLIGDAVDDGRHSAINLTKINDDPALEARRFYPVLESAGFVMSPNGFRKRR